MCILMSPLLSLYGCKERDVLHFWKRYRNAVSFQISARPAAMRKYRHGLLKEKREISDHGADSKNRETPVIRLTAEKKDISIQFPTLSQDLFKKKKNIYIQCLWVWRGKKTQPLSSRLEFCCSGYAN